MISNNTLGHIAYLFIFLGTIALGWKMIIGWPLRLLGESIWLYVGLRMGMNSIWGWAAVFVLMEMYGFYSWL